MADKAAKSDKAAHAVVELQNDESWQERLADARARRAQTLKELGREDGEVRKPRKPWEEESAVDNQTTAEPPVEPNNKFDFLDRVNVLKRVTGRETDLNDLEPRPGRNWYPEADEISDDVPARDAAPADTPQANPPEDDHTARASAAVDNIFDDPNFGTDDSEPVISLLLEPSEPMPPSGASRPWLQRVDENEDDGVETALATANPRDDGGEAEKARKSNLLGLIGIAVLVFVAIAAGPISVYAPWQARATGPATPFFGVQPALGITASFVEVPVASSTTDWRPTNNAPPAGPLRTSRPNPPEFVRTIKTFEALPQSGAATIAIKLPLSAFAYPNSQRLTPIEPRLTLSMFERISGDPTRLVALPPSLASVSVRAIHPVARPEAVLRTQ